MASMTKEELRATLTNHGIELPAANAKKEELVALYEEFVQPVESSKGEFSSDDEEVIISEKKKTSRKAATPVKTATSVNKSQIVIEEVVTESANGVFVEDVTKLSDEELGVRLRQLGVDVGPIVDSTRFIYEKKLAKLLGPASGDSSVVNGSTMSESAAADESSVVDTSVRNGEFSADEEPVDDDDESQPSVVIRKAATPLRRSARTSSKAATNSPSSPEVGTSLRQRFTGGIDATDAAGREGRFTPTPRRSIHSYKITETTTETVVKSPDGNVTRDFEYRKETSQSTDEAGGSKMSTIFSILTKLFILLLLGGVAFYLYTNYADQLGLVIGADKPVETPEAQPEVADAREPAPDQASITNI